MRILVIGAGAVGGYFGARLTAAGRDVTFLVRERRAEQLRRTALRVTSPHGEFSVEPKLLLASDLRSSPQTFDLVLLSTKAYSLESAMQDFTPAVGTETTVLPLLNGMKHLDVLTERFGKDHILGGSTRIVADLDAEGVVRSMEDLHDLVFGELDGLVTPRIQSIASTLQDAGFDDQLSPDILTFMWQKWTLLASLGAITCLMRGTIGDIAATPGGPETARAIIQEAASIAAANGYAQRPAFLQSITTRLTAAGSNLTASMYRDLSKGSPVEADQILGDLLARGRSRAMSMPLLQAAYVQLAVYSRSFAHHAEVQR